MKTILAALVAASVAFAVPAAAEPSLALRGVSNDGSTSARTEAAPAPVAAAASAPVPIRKIRVVLASPYGG